jgi:hypothetical protein
MTWGLKLLSVLNSYDYTVVNGLPMSYHFLAAKNHQLRLGVLLSGRALAYHVEALRWTTKYVKTKSKQKSPLVALFIEINE